MMLVGEALILVSEKYMLSQVYDHHGLYVCHIASLIELS